MPYFSSILMQYGLLFLTTYIVAMLPPAGITPVTFATFVTFEFSIDRSLLGLYKHLSAPRNN